jgi:hypothetical protein
VRHAVQAKRHFHRRLSERRRRVAVIAAGAETTHSQPMADENADLRAELAEARTDKKFAEMLGEVRSGFANIDAKFAALDGRIGALEGRVDARLSALERATAGIKPTIIVTGLAVAALMVGVLTYGQTWFGIGGSTRDVVRSAVSEYIQQHPAPK